MTIPFRDMLVGIRENVARLKKQGKSLEEVIAAKLAAAYDAKWGGSALRLAVPLLKIQRR